MTASDEVFEAAVFAGNAGWRVHPVWGMKAPGVCACPKGKDCPPKEQGKHPILGRWQKQATAEEQAINAWWKKHHGANIGVATGRESGFFVFDVDGEAGRASLADLESKHGPLPVTRQARSGRGDGGVHYYFAFPENQEVRNKQALLPGIDIRGDGGFAIMAPSVHSSGNKYEWLNQAPLAPAPSWLLELLKPKEYAASSVSFPINTDTRKASAYLKKMDPAISGSGGHDATFKAALHMKGFSLSESDIFSLLWNEYNPRCQPPWSEKELRHKVADAVRSNKLPDGFHVNERPTHLRAVDSNWESLQNFKPSSPPPDYVPPPSDEDAPGELMTMTADEFEALLDDDISNALKPEVFNRAIAIRQNPQEWMKLGQILRRKKIKKEFDSAVKKHDRGPIHKKTGWESQLLFKEDKNGFPILENCLHNIATILAHDPAWVGVLSYDEFLNRIVLLSDAPFKRRTKRWIEADLLEVVAWIETKYPIRPKVEVTKDAIALVANRQSSNCQTSYLESLESHDKELLDTFLIEHFGCEDTPYTRAIFSKWMIGMVARAYDPGCKFDNAIILEGGQGIKKSRFFEQLCPDLEWFTDGLSEFGSKAQAEEVEGKWIVEIAELSGFARSDIEKIKAFVTRKAENYRPAYGRFSLHSPRRFALGGTINPAAVGYLKDDENRRFWPVACRKRGQEITPEIRDMLMSEARDRYRAGEKWWIDEPDVEDLFRKEQDKRREQDPWHEKIEDTLTGEMETSVNEILGNIIKLEISKRTPLDERRVGSILKRMGWVKKRPTVNGKRPWRYFAPGHPSLFDPLME